MGCLCIVAGELSILKETEGLIFNGHVLMNRHRGPWNNRGESVG